MKNFIFFSLSLVSLLLLSSTAGATVTTYSTRSNYNSAAAGYGTTRNTDFTTKDDGTYLTYPGNDIYVDPLTLRGAVFNGARSYYNLMIYTFPTASITSNFPTGTRAFGIDLSSFYGVDGTFTVTLSSGESFQVTRTNSAVYFFGITTDAPIHWATFKFDADYIVLDNFTYVPEPEATCAPSSQDLSVPGSTNLWFAGMLQGTTDYGGDSVPAQSPVLANEISLATALTISAAGMTANCPGCFSNSPDGGPSNETRFFGTYNGIGQIVAPINSLIGVFLTDDAPNLTPAPGGTLDFSTVQSRDYTTLSPALKQPFFIGDGMTSGGDTQQIVPPPGATRLFLGSMDGFEWINNQGSFTVTVNTCPDPAPPASIAIASPAPNNGGWNNSDVTVSINSEDNSDGSGVKHITYATTGAQTTPQSVAIGDSAAVTISAEGETNVAYFAEDNAGNVENAKILSVKIDKTAPTISVLSATAGNYLLNQAVTVDYDCSDSLSGVASCAGTAVDGGSLDTSSAGAKSYTVSSTDNADNTASQTVNYTVIYAVDALFDQSKAHKSGGAAPIKIRILDANGVNLSSTSVVIHAVNVVQTSSQATSAIEEAGNSNPDFDFRYDADLSGYIFNLKTTGYGTGTYLLNFVVGSDPLLYSVGFQVRE